MSSDQQSPKIAPTHHFGRGGAGNKTVKDAKSPVVVPAATPTLKSDMYTTGRGGTGNMAKNDPNRPEEARAAQDVEDIPEMSLPEGPRSTGRGGGGNIVRPLGEEKKTTRQDSGTKDRSGLKALAEKGKELLSGKKKVEGEK